jgi:hypothetical protein
MKAHPVVLAAALFVVAQVGASAETRLYLASQYDWGAKLGFYLDFEGATLAELPVILGVADGQNWRFDRAQPGFVAGRPYRIRGVIAPDGSQLYVDGDLVAESKGTWRPSEGPLQANDRPSWAADMGDWLAAVHSVRVSVSRGGREAAAQDFEFPAADRAVPLQLFELNPSRSGELTAQAGETVTIDVTLEFAASDPHRWAPLIDLYGQCRFADWPEKVRADGDLAGDPAREDAELAKMPPSADYDEYGGYAKADWREEPTGFFRVLRRNGYWWLISPAGNLCFYLGVCGFPNLTWPATPVSEREYLFQWLPPDEKPWSVCRGLNYWGVQYGTAYACLYAANLIRKYGAEDWADRAQAQGARRLRAWAFSGVGKWGGQQGLVSIPVLHRWGTPSLVRHPDVFDPAVRETFRKELEAQVAPHRDDPTVLGWSLGNEYDEIISTDEVRDILRKPAGTPAKRALLDYAADKLYRGELPALAAAWGLGAADRAALYAGEPSPPAEDLEKLRAFYATEYYGLIYRTIKAMDPNHLYLGFWIVPGWWTNESDWRLIAPYCDAIGYDRYSRDYADPLVQRLAAETDKPVLCGEFSFPSFYEGSRGFGRYGAVSARDDAEAGDLYARWVQAAAADPYCVGVSYFKYRDQPLTGRGPGRGDRVTIGEHYAFGVVTETDRPKWEQVRRMREANLTAARLRLEASATAPAGR